MHTIKLAARRAARIVPKDDKDETYATKFIPFRRISSSTKQLLMPTRTEDSQRAPPLDNSNQFAHGGRDDGDPDSIGTSPVLSENLSPTNRGSDRTDFSDASHAALRKQNESGLDTGKGKGTGATNDIEAQGGSAKPRSRLAKLMGKKDKGKDNDLGRTTSTTSKPKKKFTVMGQVKTVLLGNWINVLLICVPLGIAFNEANISPYASFAINFLAIIPLAGILSYSTEEISLRVGETLGGLLNASFGNAVELIVSIIALTQGKILIVQTSLIGSILSNLLLVMGMCFFFGGLKRIEQFFNTTVAQTSASLLALAIGAIIIPTTFLRWGTGGTYAQRNAQIPALSRGIAIILLVVYGAYLIFQLKSHSSMFADTGGAATTRKKSVGDEGSIKQGFAAIGQNQTAHAGGSVQNEIFDKEGKIAEDEDDDKEEPQLSVIGAVTTLIIATVFIGVNSEFMVDGIEPVANYISPEFIGLILIPIVGNAAEHATAVTVAIKDKMDLAIGVAVGSSLQISLLVLPLMVVIGWIIGPAGPDQSIMTLDIDGFLLGIVFIAVLLVNYLIGDGRSHWMEGVMLMTLYVMIAVAAYLYPNSAAAVVG